MQQSDLDKTMISDILGCLPKQGPQSHGGHIQTLAELIVPRLPLDIRSSRSAEAWAAMLQGQVQFLSQRLRSQTSLRLFNPNLEKDGWESKYTILQINTADRPFLVDSVTFMIAEQGLSVHLIAHPLLRVGRDPGGHLMSLTRSTPGQKAKGQVDDSVQESFMHFELDRVTNAEELRQLETAILSSLKDGEQSVADWPAMTAQLNDTIECLKQRHGDTTEASLEETVAFLNWLREDHFTFLAFRRYSISEDAQGPMLTLMPDTGLGLLRDPTRKSTDRSAELLLGTAENRVWPLVLTKTSARSTVHRAGYMDYVGVMRFDEEGKLIGEDRYIGLYTSTAYNRRPWRIPCIRQKVELVIQESGLGEHSHGGKALLHIMETLPRDELLQASAADLYRLSMGILNLQERQRTRLFIRADRFQRFCSCLVFIPRDRFNTEVRQSITDILRRSLRGQRVDFSVQLGESRLARLHIVVQTDPDSDHQFDPAEIEDRLVETVRSWDDRLRDTLLEKHGHDRGIDLADLYSKAFPAAYVEDVSPWVASFDVDKLSRLKSVDDMALSLYRPRKRLVGQFRFKIFRWDLTIPLSEVLPILENLGLQVVSERPYHINLGDQGIRWIQDFDIALTQGQDLDLDRVKTRFQTAFEQVVRGFAENDGFNKLILSANLDWRQVAALRACCKYLLQGGTPFSQPYMESTLVRHPVLTRLLVELFEARLDPAREKAQERTAQRRELLQSLRTASEMSGANCAEIIQRLEAAPMDSRQDQIDSCEACIATLLDSVSSLDEDRIVRSFQTVIQAMLRTNYWQISQGQASAPHPYISFKLDPGMLPDLPKPKPLREIFVCSPRVEGVHLRGGLVARGGLRWSDRREDFRTEVLGLMKAQTVKNTIIVPLGAKGGFVVKNLPESGSREEVMAEVVTCYRMFISGLLDLTDNRVEGRIVHPPNVVRQDDDDSYLVVAADKGTATFSDIANSVAADYGFWLGDAFASGGSVGYDHKGMGITAKGAWESVKRHFRELGKDTQTTPFTVVGIGDMSGDVFGNGMLLSEHIQLKAAFNHMHIFLDPDPDTASAFAERRRLFELGRSSWTDYDASLISAGGGIFSRADKSIPLSEPVKAWLGVEEDQLTPNALVHAILKAPVELLWNGGIGTYVKATTESDDDVGDRANNAVRVNGNELGCRVVGEGGNLGLTQRGRIEFALHGGCINTDFIDNSAGVDCSDHEVNIKILLDGAISEGVFPPEERTDLLAQMTDEVSALVLRNNYLQSQALTLMKVHSVPRIGSKAHLIDVLEASGDLDRELEDLPSKEVIEERKKGGLGLTRPELAVLLSYSKIKLYQDLLNSDVPEDPYLSRELLRYFPTALRDRFAEQARAHSLSREIIATAVTNSVVNRMGATFVLRMQEDTGASPAEIARAFTVAREAYGIRAIWEKIELTDNQVPSDAQTELYLQIWELLRHATRWLLMMKRGSLNIAEQVERMRPGIAQLREEAKAVQTEQSLAEVEDRMRTLTAQGFGEELASSLALAGPMRAALDIVEVANQLEVPVTRAAKVHYALGAIMHFEWLGTQIERLQVIGPWHANARAGLRDTLLGRYRETTIQVLESGADQPDEALVDSWLATHRLQTEELIAMLTEMRASPTMDYAMISVALRALEKPLQAG